MHEAGEPQGINHDRYSEERSGAQGPSRHTTGELSNLVHDIVCGTRGVADARHEYTAAFSARAFREHGRSGHIDGDIVNDNLNADIIPVAAFAGLRVRTTSQDAPKPDPEPPPEPDDIPDTPPTEPPPVPIRDPRPDSAPPGPYITRWLADTRIRRAEPSVAW